LEFFAEIEKETEDAYSFDGDKLRPDPSSHEEEGLESAPHLLRCFFSSFAIALAAASALCGRSDSDKTTPPFKVGIELASGRVWHRFIISLMAEGVTKSARPMRMITSLPRRASARNVAGVMRPRKKIEQASLSVKGASAATSTFSVSRSVVHPVEPENRWRRYTKS